jgi:hypothetical protein
VSVKINDLIHNLSRVDKLPAEEAAFLTKRYTKALNFLWTGKEMKDGTLILSDGH